MAEHTPGPWSAEKAVKRNGYWEADIRVGSPANAGNILATTFMGAGGGLINSQAAVEANARLIAAAPAMLEALKCFLDDERFQISVGGNPNAIEAMLAKANAAYRSALGADASTKGGVE